MKKKTTMVLCLLFSMCLLLCSCAAPDKSEKADAEAGRDVKVDGGSLGRPLTAMDYDDPDSFVEESSDEEPSDEDPSDTEPSDEEPSDEDPSDTEPSDQEPSDEKPQEKVNEHYNPNNNIFEEDALSIRPCYVYWDGDYLVAECYVLNGFDRAVSNIEVTSLKFSNHDVLIADAYFGVLKNLTLDSGEYVKWTFRFGADCIAQYGADLYYLYCEFAYKYN